MLDKDAVNHLADELELHRFKNGNWRLRNLGRHGRRRDTCHDGSADPADS